MQEAAHIKDRAAFFRTFSIQFKYLFIIIIMGNGSLMWYGLAIAVLIVGAVYFLKKKK
ncbi:hypothetical protein BH11BAC7_BH11BAC7_10570 [soil metagenome]